MAHISLVTLGVDDQTRATRFYEALGWRRSSPSVAGEVSFLEGGAVVLALWERRDLAQDAALPSVPARGTGAVALAMNLPSEQAVDGALRAADQAPCRADPCLRPPIR